VTLRAMISQLEDILGRRAHIHTLPRDVCDVPYTCADIGKAASKLGYCPRIPFAIGLERFVEWFVQPGRGLRDSTVMKHR
jgi:UDP-glucuronate 4-epimerase